jgi:hypothetical protein
MQLTVLSRSDSHLMHRSDSRLCDHAVMSSQTSLWTSVFSDARTGAGGLQDRPVSGVESTRPQET